ncbi:MAG: prepilin peptidase [Candidatus Niyogibacteria bacterium]|nr:prepilin peptidase [Candidatus Niyogibacteria bacterium]
MASFFVLILGLIVGSFLNVVILRLNTGESAMTGRSRCFSCGAQLQWFDLVPLLSFLWLRGKCRTCGSRISCQYPLVELSTGLVFYAIYFKWMVFAANFSGVMGAMFFLWGFAFWSIFLVSAVYDLRHKILPDQNTYLLIIIALLGIIIFDRERLWPSVAIGGALFLFFAGLWFISRGRWMGFGDAKLFFGAGLFLGWPQALLALFFSFWIGAIISIAVALWRKKLNLKSEIPFAPFIFLGSFIAFLWGDAIYFWHLNLLI